MPSSEGGRGVAIQRRDTFLIVAALWCGVKVSDCPLGFLPYRPFVFVAFFQTYAQAGTHTYFHALLPWFLPPLRHAELLNPAQPPNNLHPISTTTATGIFWLVRPKCSNTRRCSRSSRSAQLPKIDSSRNHVQFRVAPSAINCPQSKYRLSQQPCLIHTV